MPGPYDPDDDPILREFEQRVLGRGALAEADRVYRSSTPTPAAPEEAPAEEVQKRAIANRAYQSVAPALGGSKGVYGFDADMFDPDERVRQAREAYGKLEPEAAPTRQWEEEFTRKRSRLTEADAERARISSLWFGEGWGHPAEANKARDAVLDRMDRYDQGLAQARAADVATYEKNRRITPASADAVAATGLVSPEDAVKMTEGQAQAFLKSNVAALGARMRGQNLGAYKTDVKEGGARVGALEQAERGAAANESREKVAQIGGDARVKAAGMHKGQGGAGAAPEARSDEDLTMMLYQMGHGLTPLDTVKKFVAGSLDMGSVSPATFDHLTADLATLKDMKPKDYDALRRATMSAEQAGRGRTVASSNDPRLIIKERTKYNSAVSKFLPAYRAVKKLGPKLQVLARYGLQGWAGQLQKVQLTPEEHAEAGSLYQLLTEYAHANFGAAFTKNESELMAGAVGMNLGEGVDWFASPARILQFMNNYKAELARHDELLGEQLGQGR